MFFLSQIEVQEQMTISIHQPNFFPWLGYFDKINSSDAFVFLDDVQFPKKGGSWTNRVKLISGNEPRWITATLDRNYHGVRNINEMLYKDNDPWREKVLNTILLNYKKAPFFEVNFHFFENLINNKNNCISEYNIHSVLAINEKLGIPYEKIYTSSNLSYKGSSNELLISITKILGGTAYMCGGGAEGYQDDALFQNVGIELKYQDYKHPFYPQYGVNELQPGLSIIDAVMNIGWEKTKELLKIKK
jgi:hypothetical protein